MDTVLALLVGGLYASGLYLMMGRSLAKLIIGLSLLGHAANLLIFTAAGVSRGRPPIVASGAAALARGASDPLPQALILTAIVISFGVLVFAVVLVVRSYEAVGTDDLDAVRGTET